MVLGIFFLLFGIYTIVGGVNHLDCESMEIYEKMAFFVVGGIFTYSGASRVLKKLYSPVKKKMLVDEFIREEKRW